MNPDQDEADDIPTKNRRSESAGHEEYDTYHGKVRILLSMIVIKRVVNIYTPLDPMCILKILAVDGFPIYTDAVQWLSLYRDPKNIIATTLALKFLTIEGCTA